MLKAYDTTNDIAKVEQKCVQESHSMPSKKAKTKREREIGPPDTSPTPPTQAPSDTSHAQHQPPLIIEVGGGGGGSCVVDMANMKIFLIL